jgi:hypothetical protein
VPQVPSPARPTGNAAPFIDAVVVSDTLVRSGGAVTLKAKAHDLNAGDALTYAWRASGGTFSDATAEAPTWTAPAESGAVTLTLTVTDDKGAAAALDFSVVVGAAGPSASSADRAVFNRWPSVAELSAVPSPESLVDEPVALQSAGVDEDGDALTFAWTATCEGTFDDPTGARARFTPSTVPTAACNNCRLDVVMRDGYGGQVRDSVELCVVRRFPPTIDSTSQSVPGALAGELVRLGVTATDPQGEPLTFTWTTNAGALGPTTGTSGTSALAWTELTCVPPDLTPTVTVTVKNASGLSASHTFTVQWGSRRCGARSACAVTLGATAVTLREDCTTEGAVYIPDGFTFEGAGHTLTAVEAEPTPEAHWKGGVLRNRGATAHVRDVTVTARGLAEVCDAGEDRLSGIRFEGASGSITDTQVRDLHEKDGQSGCQEGVAIEVRHAEDATDSVKVDVLRNRLSGYQKGGILVAGRVDATVTDNEVDGAGPLGTIAQNGIQLGYGATGKVTGNVVSGHSYTGPTDVATGILVVGGAYYGAARPLCKDVVIQGNTLDGNDVGIDLVQAEGLDTNGDWIPPAEATRIQVLENELNKADVTNGYVYQAGISDLGSGNVISLNKVTGPGYEPATQPGATFDVDVLSAGTERRLAFLSPARTVATGACSGMLVVQSQDVVGNLASLVAPTLMLSATGSAGTGATFHLQPDCSDAPVTQLDLSGPQQEALFYFKAEQPGDLELTVTSDTLTLNQTQTVQ